MKRMTYDDISIFKLQVNPLFRMMTIHLFYVDGLLIDTGPSIRKRTLASVFRALSIRQAALTHHHEDHAGLALWLNKHLSVPVFCDQEALDFLSEKETMPWYRTWFSGVRLPVDAVPFPDVLQTPHYHFYPIRTPGHTSDHVCLLEPDQGWLFTGDLYITPYPKVFLKEESIHDYIESLRNLRRYDYGTVFCAHEGVVPNGKEKMEEKLAYLERTRNEVIRLHRLGHSDRAILKKLFPENVKLEMATFGSFSRLNLIRSCYRE